MALPDCRRTAVAAVVAVVTVMAARGESRMREKNEIGGTNDGSKFCNFLSVRESATYALCPRDANFANDVTLFPAILRSSPTREVRFPETNNNFLQCARFTLKM